MAYTTINKPSEYFNTKLYTGNGSTQSLTGVNFQPDWVWCKDRSTTSENLVFDILRGATNYIKTNATSSQATISTTLTSFDADGFSIGNNGGINTNGNNYVAWNWLGGGTGASNTDGSTTSTVSANQTSGFSVVKWVGVDTTVGHGLNAVPEMIIVKNTDDATNWFVYHKTLGNNKYLNLNLTSAETTSSSQWNSTSPTSSVFTVGSGFNNANYIAYVFAPKKGFSRFGSYVGTGSDAYAPFIYCGFKPAFVLFKRAIGGTDSWFINDTARATYNPSQQYMRPNETSAEGTSSAHKIDILSNGFKIRSSDTAYNTSDNTYIYMAFAENPLVGTNNIPATAR
jgi:hypothetical protein